MNNSNRGRIFLVILSILMGSCSFAQATTRDPLDWPINVHAADELNPITSELLKHLNREDIDNANEALSTLWVYTRSTLDPAASRAEKEKTLVAMTNGLTARQLILFANIISLEGLRQGLTREESNPSEAGQSNPRKSFGAGRVARCISIIHKYSQKTAPDSVPKSSR